MSHHPCYRIECGVPLQSANVGHLSIYHNGFPHLSSIVLLIMFDFYVFVTPPSPPPLWGFSENEKTNPGKVCLSTWCGPPKLANILHCCVFLMQVIDGNCIFSHSLAKLANMVQGQKVDKHTPPHPAVGGFPNFGFRFLIFRCF